MVESISERNMFSSTLDSSWSERSRRGWTALTSFGLQAFVTTVLLILPLLRPTGLPSFHQLSTPISLGQPTEGPTVSPTLGRKSRSNKSNSNHLPPALRAGDRQTNSG